MIDPASSSSSWYAGRWHGDESWAAPARELRVSTDWSNSAIRSLDEASIKILEPLAPPGSEAIRTRDLMLGQAQRSPAFPSGGFPPILPPLNSPLVGGGQ